MIGKKKYRGSIAFSRKNGRPLVRGQFIQPLERRLYLSSGNLDLTFGNQGMAAVPQLGSVRCSAIQPDGKILVAGSVEHFNPNTSATTADFEILRLNTDGSLDTSFGTQGAVFKDFGGNEDTPSAIVVDSSGKIYVIGASADWRQPTRYSDLVIAALNSDGSLNSSFLGGTVAPSNPGFERGTSIALDGDQLVLGGCAGASITNNTGFLVRVNSNGFADSTFNGNGMLITPNFGNSNGITGLAIDSQGRIVASAASQNGDAQLDIARFTTSGAFDTTFGANGIETIPGGIVSAGPVAVQNDGHIVATSDFWLPGASTAPGLHVRAIRLTDAGQLDTTFGSGGAVDTGIVTDGGSTMELASNGQLIVGGADIAGTRRVALVRLNSDGSPDANFGFGGTLEVATGSMGSLQIQPDGKYLLTESTPPQLVRVDPSLAAPPATAMTASFTGGSGVSEGSSAALNGTATGGVPDSYEWDFNYDGTSFVPDALGPQAVFSAAQLDGPSTYQIALRVRDINGSSSISVHPAQVFNVAPVGTISVSGDINVGNTETVSMLNVTDVPADLRAGLRYTYSMDYGAPILTDTTSSSITIPADLLKGGRHTIQVVVKDKDSGSSSYGAAFNVYDPSLGTVTGTVFIDVNENGVLDPGEPSQAGWNVSADSTHLGDYLLSQPTGTTDANGHYTIIGVQPGDPWIEAAGVGQWTITSPASNEYLVNVAAGQTVSGVNFATVPRFNTAHGNIFNDANRNGVRDVNESPLTNWTVYVDLNNNGVFDIYSEPQGITDSLGNFTVQGNFLLGDYTLRALPKQGWYPTMPPSGAITFKQTSTNPITGLNLGFVQSAGISGQIFNDTNGDGVQQPDEALIPNALVYVDLNGNGVFDVPEPAAATDANGDYLLTGLTPGTYAIRTLLTANWAQTGPAANASQIVTLPQGQNVINVNFGEAQTNASISGTFFYDTNGNGVWDSGEAISPSWGVFLDTSGDGIYESGEPELTCNSQGQYTFANLAPGAYRVRPTAAANWTETAPAGGTEVITVSSGQTIANVNFGEVKGAAKTTATPTALFTGDSYSVNLSYGGFHSVTSWTLNWGDGSIQTITGSPTSVSHTFTSASGTSPFTILAWANTVDGDAPAAPLTLAVYAAPLLNNGLLSLSGTSGNDSVSFTNSGGLLTLNLDGATKQYNSSAVTKVSYASSGGNDTINLSGAIPATLNLASGNSTVTNNDSAPVFVAAGTGKTTINATSGTTIIPANSGTGIQQLAFAAINISAGAKVIFANTSSTLGDYSHHANRTVAIVDAGGLSVASGGTLDMGDNDMILKYAPSNEAAANTQVFNLLKSGITTNIDWSGSGITSSEANYDANFSIGARAVGFMDNNNWGDTSFDGVALADFNQVLIKFTYYGDVNCDGIFDSQDVNQLIGGRSHIAGATGWENCDLDYDGVTSTSTDQNLFFTGRSAYQTFGAL